MIEILMYTAGWVLFVLGQAQNSVRSTANGLSGWKGWVCWLHLQAVNLLLRAFCCSLFYEAVMQFVTGKIKAVGLPMHAYSIAGISGLAANAFLYQVFGLLPWLRVEVQDLAPPQNPPATPKGPTQ